jgi:hypothetical protein
VRDAIEEAMAAGQFDNLPGRGKPLDLSDEDNPFVPDDMRLAYRMLRSAGYSLPWVEARNDLEAARTALERQARVYSAAVRARLEQLPRLPAYMQPRRWQQLRARHAAFLAEYGGAVEALNHKIDVYNLQVPVLSLQVPQVSRVQALALVSVTLPETAP